MLPPDGWRLEAELYSPTSNKTKSRPSRGPSGQAGSPDLYPLFVFPR